MTKVTIIFAVLAVLSTALSMAGFLPALLPQTLVALTLCGALFNVIGQGERHPL
ncbi:hypothetical protein [Opitutus terrae]|uniref:Uncharacterized protein n=1 Tax=Opitutus terrae (strain DSM 11246 / JCM 15787 / PB90-1) TaxID=452637 RepID=B1ZPJ7_OPITP|nr:hypothetical protein [Opitutus terrae]ACB74516.1 hypothetical protein Oter_1231 [Opitutus terrae PB90-1]